MLRAADRTWEGNVQLLIDSANGFDDAAIASFLRRLPPHSESDIHRHNFEAMGYVNFYLLTTVVALPGVFLFRYMMRSGLADVSIGSAGRDGA